MLNCGISIRPSRDIRTNYAQISELAKRNPVAITVNGREDIVVLSHEDFIEQQRKIAELQAKVELFSHLAQSREDIKNGRVKEMGNVFDELYKDIESGKL